MDAENSASDENSAPVYKSKENVDKQVNGISNGYAEKHKSHKSDHKDKHRDKDRDRDKSKSKDHKSSSRDKDRHGSSKDKDRHSSSHKSSSKDKERSSGDKDKERGSGDKERGSGDKDKHRSRDKDKHRDKDKDEKKSSKDKEHKSSHDKEHKSKDKDKEREKDKHRDREGKDKDKDRDRDKHKSSSSKDKHSSSSKDKHRDKEKDRDRHHSSSKSKDKDRKEKERKSEKYDGGLDEKQYKSEKNDADSSKEDSIDEDDQKLVIREEGDSQNSDDQNLVIKEDTDVNDQNISQASSCDYNLSQFKEESKLEGYEEDEEAGNGDDVEGDDSVKKSSIKEEDESDEDLPLARRVPPKRKIESDEEDDDPPLNTRKKPKKEKKVKKKRDFSEDEEEEEEEEYHKPVKKEKKPKTKTKAKKEVKTEEVTGSPKKRKKKEEEEQEVWKWWEEDKREDGVKWTFLEHKGPVFAPPYERLPKDVKFYYDGEEMKLSEETEEVAGFYAKMLEHDYTTKDAFNNNFFKDWRKVMTDKEKAKITDLKRCNFKKLHAYFMEVAEKNRNRTKEEKAALKEKNEAIMKEYGLCVIDGHKEKIGNFKIEPPGLFRGRGEHPKMGMLKRRVQPEDVLINCSKDSKIPVPPEGHKWREVRHDNGVTWLASWTENVQNQVKYVMLNPSSKLKGEKDWQKYETARRLHKCIDKIRREYQLDWKSKEMRIRQRAVALYFIDKLALRAGNEKDEDQADTVGCCSLRVEHIQLFDHRDDKDYVVVFDFLGKDSIRYYNEVPVEKRVYKNLQLFMENKSTGDDLFDRLNTSVMNKHLNELMEGLTAKVFRTYNASITLQQQLEKLTDPDYSVTEMILAYNRANRAVAILCNHQRAVPKSHEKSMEKLKEKIVSKKEAIEDAERQVKDAQRDAKRGSVKEKVIFDKKKKLLQRLKDQLIKLEVQETDRDENKTIALSTSKLNYLDPRISVAWCKKFNVPIDKIYNKTQRDKFRWAIDMAGPDYIF